MTKGRDVSRSLIYLDANATSPPDPAVWEVMQRVAREAYGNPGSAHRIGRQARQVLEEARETAARFLGARPQELIFTSGGTESTNLAIQGLAAPIPAEKRTLVLTGSEHPATSESAQRLQQQGWKLITLPLDTTGLLQPTALEELPWTEVGLVAVILAQNETGVLQDFSRLKILCAEHAVPWHVDIVQAVGRIPISFHELGATAASFGVHKCHGPRGIGGLLLREGVPFVPSTVGGFQEMSRRPGTEAVALAAGLAEILRLWTLRQTEDRQLLCILRDRFESGLLEQASPLQINGREAPRLPNTSNITFPGVEAEALMIALDLEGICCSLGSACASGSPEPSPVLLAMGLDPLVARSSLRFSLHRYLTTADIEEAIRRIAKVVQRLRALSS